MKYPFEINENGILILDTALQNIWNEVNPKFKIQN